MLMVMWRSWHVCDEITHDKSAPSVEASRRFLQSYVTSLIGIQQHPGGDYVKGKMAVIDDGGAAPLLHVKPSRPAPRKWQPPPENWAKLNVDGSFSNENGSAGAGMILRGHDGSIIFSACRSLWSCTDILHAELAGCMEGLALAHQWTSLPIIVECDSLLAVQMVNSKEQDPSQYAMVVQEVKRLKGERECVITHISREQNNVSHSLANFGRTEDRTVVWIQSGPDNIPSMCVGKN